MGHEWLSDMKYDQLLVCPHTAPFVEAALAAVQRGCSRVYLLPLRPWPEA